MPGLLGSLDPRFKSRGAHAAWLVHRSPPTNTAALVLASPRLAGPFAVGVPILPSLSSQTPLPSSLITMAHAADKHSALDDQERNCTMLQAFEWCEYGGEDPREL